MYKLIVSALFIGSLIGVSTGVSLGSTELAGGLAGLIALVCIAAPAAVVYAVDRRKTRHSH